MPITPSTQINPTTMGNNWGTGVSNNAQKWLNKYLNPKALFNANPQQSQVAWSAGIQRAQSLNSYAAGLAAADPNQAATNAQNYGVTNYANSGTAKAYKYKAKVAALAAAETAVLQTVASMPKGSGANNEARMLAWARGMAAYKGKI